jgi:16S rRNA (guanine1207-N2)-methyltransferase
MSSGALPTLVHALDAGLPGLPQPPARILFINAEVGPGLRDVLAGHAVQAAQADRGAYLAAAAAGLDAKPCAEGMAFDAALVLSGRHRGAGERDLAEALERTRAGGTVVVAGLKDNGIASLRKRIGEAFPIDGSVPKHHGVAFWFRVPAGARDLAVALRVDNPDVSVDGRFRSAPGMFSHDRIDPGSALLAASLPSEMGGHVADFGAGWGYLAAELLARCPRVKALDLYEADAKALDAARGNLAGATVPLSFHWHDLTSEAVPRRFDAIVTNPPFHAGRAADPSLGQGFITRAAAALKPGGRIFLVANRRLPYERTLAALFRDVKEIGGDGAFKVLSARR